MNNLKKIKDFFFKFSPINLLIILYQLTKFEAPSYNNFQDIMITNFQSSNLQRKIIGCEPESRMLPTPREFCRHILSERTFKAASNKRRLHPVSGGISL